MRLLRASLLLLSVAAWPAFAQSPGQLIDQGNLLLYLRDQPIGAETFGVESRADSIISEARSYRKARANSKDMIVEKQMVLTASRESALRFYQSNETVQGRTFITGVVAGSEEDTALTVYHEERQGAGVAKRLVAPPGKVFVLDSGMYSLFNLICLNLHGKTFDTRPISLLTLSAVADTVIEAEVRDLGRESIRWGSKPVQARKLQLRDRGTVFQVWAHPTTGKMLRLVHEPSGLRVEREAPDVKKRSTPTPKPGG